MRPLERTNEELKEEEKRKIFYFKHRLASGEIKDVEVFSGAINIDNPPLLLSFVKNITKKLPSVELLPKRNSFITQHNPLPNNIDQFGV